MPSGAKPGDKRSRGRPKGSKNKRTIDVEETLRRLNCNPIEGMAMIAMGLADCGPDKGKPTTGITLELRAKMMVELAPYIAPRLKQSEHTGAEGGPIVVSWRPPPAE